MNWVGGARSRVKQQNERKIQKEFFERTRLMKKIKKARPTSPGEGGMRATISQDLLFLQTLNNIHGRDMGKLKQEPSRKPVMVDLDSTGRNVRRPERNLELPMSPIGKPSTLNFLDTSTISSLDLSHYKNQPKVSTQKVPHQTVLRGFAPANQPQFGVERNQHPVLERRHQASASSVMNAPPMPETVIPTNKKPHFHTRGNGRDSHYQWNDTYGLINNGTKGKPLAGVLERTHRKRSTWERSYDHETPFNFESRGTKRPRLQHVPQSKRSLLEFHRQQGVDGATRHAKGEPKCLASHNKKLYGHKDLWKRQPSIAPKNPEEGASVSGMEATLPTQQAFELKVVQDAPTDFGYSNWCSSKAPFGGSMHASMAESFLEEPLRRPTTRNPEHPKSVSTVFDESILGPISHQKKSKLAHLKSAEESTSSSKPRDRGKPKTLSTFEKMMLSIEQSRPLATRSTSCELEKGEFEKAPREAGDMVYSGAQHVEWRKFTMEEPFAELPVMKAKETTQKKQQLLQLRSESQGKAQNAAEEKLKKPLLGMSDYRSKKNISVMEELFCLEEELTSSLESENSLTASQDVPLTQAHLMFPEEPIQHVPQTRPSHKATMLDEAAGSSQEEAEKTFAEVPLCSHREELEGKCGKPGELGVQPDHGSHCIGGDKAEVFRTSCGTQTDNPPTKLLKEALCECDIWSADIIRLKSRVQVAAVQSSSLPTKQASAQTSPISFQVDCAVQTDVLHGTAALVPAVQHSGGRGHSTLQDQGGEQRASQGGATTDGIVKGDGDYSSTCIQELEGEISRLRKELLTTQSTVIWQSLMLKLQQM